MSKFSQRLMALTATLLLSWTMMADDYQLPDPHFEDWSGAAFDSKVQPKYWHGSNVEQLGFKFNFTNRETGRTGYCVMVQDKEVGALGITEVGPGYFSMGTAWQYMSGISTSTATAGTYGGTSFAHRPDSISVWIKRTGSNTDKEDFHILFYSWSGTAKGVSYKAKNGSCSSVEMTDEESDIRIALDGNECRTTTVGKQIAEGWLRERHQYNDWTNVRIPIYYLNSDVPQKCNVIFSASNYPNFRANSGLYAGNSLYVDDVELIYSSKIQKLYVDSKEWKGFDPNSSEVQYYALGEDVTKVPVLEAMRGAGSLTNAKGTAKSFPGRKLSGSEIQIEYGDLEKKPTVITVTSEDGKSTSQYRIQFQRAASSNAKLASVSINGTPLATFSPTKYNYTVELPYGTTEAPVITAEGQEEQQSVHITQPETVDGTATIVVTAANGTTKLTYTLTFKVGLLADNTLTDILVNGVSLPGFTPTQAIYKVSLPTTTTTMPEVKAVSAYPEGEQTIVYSAPEVIDGGTYTISVSTPGNTVPKVYKLNFKLEASSYSYLSNLLVGGQPVEDFLPENFTYYVNMPMGTTSLPQVEGVLGEPSQTVTVTPLADGVVDGTVRVTVTAGNKSDQSVYKVVFTTEKSEVSTLLGIKIGGVELEDFEPDKLTYTYTLPVGTTELPVIEPVAFDQFQAITVTSAGVNGKTRITVTAGNGSTTVYQITFSVQAYTDNTLAGIFLDGELLEGFNPEVNEYTVVLPKGATKLPEVTYTKRNDRLQEVNERPLTNSLNGDYKITVRPQSGASRTYVLHFVTDKSTNTALAGIYLNGVALDGFRPDVLAYVDTLPEGVSTIPEVTYAKAEESQRVLSVQENMVQTITVTAESGAQSVYTITFVVQVSENAFLNMIYVDGTELEDFRADSLTYSYRLTTPVCPTITVDKAPGQQVTITAPYAAGTAYIKVKPEQGTINTYVIEFESAATTTVQLDNILVNGESLADFAPVTMHYTATYSGALPEVSFVKGDENQTVSLLWNGSVAWLYVQDTEGNRAAYSVTFSRQLSGNNALTAILIDGTPMDEFVPGTHDYTRSLPAGSAYPQVGYVAAENAQVVFFGQTEKGKWAVTVAAEDGTLATYTVAFTILPYDDATLANLEVEGYTISFDPNTFVYPLSIDEKRVLPAVHVTAKDGQTVVSYNASETEQRVEVRAQSGAANTYVIMYTREESANALLANILVDGVGIHAFDPDTHDYTVTLPQGTKVVPNVFPIGQLDNQIITTCYGRPNDTTRIHVVAQDGTTADYTVAFPVALSSNTKLGELIINGEMKDVNETDYDFVLPFGSVAPYELSYAKAEAQQQVDYIAAPLSGVTKLVVKAENGDTRTYSIRYTVAQPQGENIVQRVDYEYVNAANETMTGSVVPAQGETVINLPYGAKSFTITEVVKNYAEQSIVFYNGGIRRGATIVASSNREGEADAVYTIVPKMPAFETTGKLSDLQFKGTTIANFRPDVYNYTILVTTQPTADNFAGIAYNGKTVTKSSINAQKKQITLTVQGGETYSVCWYYTNYDKLFDFSGNWVAASQGVGYKPSAAWKVPADCDDGYTWRIGSIVNLTYTTGKEVTPGGTNGVMLSTLRGAPMNGSCPGMMTLGTMALNLTSNGNSTSSVTKNASVGTEFKNTPETLEFLVKPLSTSNITNWKMWLTMSDGSNYKESNYTGNFSAINTWSPVSVPISYTGVGTVSKFNVMLSSCDQENAKQFGGGTIYESSVIYDQIHFGYNSELTAVTVDGVAASKSGNTFTVNVGSDYVGVPSLKFTGKVHDQMQTIEWLNDGEWINGELKAQVTNYGENSQDNTVYTVVLKRTSVTSLGYEASFGGYATTMNAAADTTFVWLPYGTKALPDFRIVPESIHQHFVVGKSGKNVVVTVTAENGASETHVYAFRGTTNNDATLQGIFATDDKGGSVTLESAGGNDYTLTAEQMPLISFEKQHIGQNVDLKYTDTGATLLVTAADGVAHNTYTITRIIPTVTTSGKIEEFELGGNIITGFGGTDYEMEAERPQTALFFTRQDLTDSVVHVQSADKMEWVVYGSEEHTYTFRYPTTPSSNANLANILLDGGTAEAFRPYESEFAVTADTTIVVTVVTAEEEQTVALSSATTADGAVYTATVTAADGVTQKQYMVVVSRPKSSDATLAGIMLDSVMIEGFSPDKTTYTYVLGVPAVKTAQPQMPSVTYIAGHEGQKIEMEPALVGETTILTVTSEDGSVTKDYYLTVEAGKSHCADLTGIVINGEAIDHFESGRHYYSHSLKTSTIEVDYTSDDRFQTVTVTSAETVAGQEYTYTLHVVAEDGNTADYQVEIYIENQSNDAQLADILLNRQEFRNFLHDINPDLTAFDPGNNTYDINLPSGTTVLPDVSARLKMDGQSVDIKQFSDSVLLYVTAVDGTENIYRLYFHVPQSTNANLSMIYLDGDSLQGFIPGYNFYQIDLPVGVNRLPEVVAQKGESTQTVTISEDTDKMEVSIHVQAEDPSSRPNTYLLVFRYTRSEADTLNGIFEDGVRMADFAPQTFYYTRSLPVGTSAFPELSWEESDDWQTIRLDTVEQTESSLILQIFVTAESGKRNVYTVSYTIEKSDVNTLRMIFVDQKQLAGFDPATGEYHLTLTAAYAAQLGGQMPDIDYISGDDYQTVIVAQMPDSLAGKSLGYKTVITVTAATGSMRTYTIHYPVELSTETTLNMINIGGKPLTNYDSERFNYKIEIEMADAVPVVSVIKKEDAQTYEIIVLNDTVYVTVTAEDIAYTQTYTLVFERRMSAVTTLRDILLTDATGKTLPSAQFPFRPEEYTYVIDLQYEPSTPVWELLPVITPVLYDENQTVDTVHRVLPNGDVQVDITVTAPNGEDQASYLLTFHFLRPSDATLSSIMLNGVEIEQFNPDVTEYNISHPYGTDEKDYFTQEAITVRLSDQEASYTVYTNEEGVIFITVVAQDGVTEITYVITQSSALDNDNALAWITLDNEPLRGFDPEITFYTYYIMEGNSAPGVQAEARSVNAEVSMRDAAAGDTCLIICTAADGSERRYYIHFAFSSLNPGLEPTGNDVLLKRLPGSMQYMAATLRSGVTFALYDQRGQLLLYERVPVANPNDAEVITDAQRKERLNDVVDTRSGLLVDVLPGQPYFYVFYANGKQRLASGKIMAY